MEIILMNPEKHLSCDKYVLTPTSGADMVVSNANPHQWISE
jgi:hypothetical protein